MSDLKAAALELARSGVAVFPCNPDKSPRTPRAFYDATTDEATIEGWDWNDGGLIGAAIAPGTFVLDVDPRNGGQETLGVFMELPPTYEVKTRSGGQHLYYTVPESTELRASLGPGIDVKRHDKGYVIVPPSEGYNLARRMAVQPAPDWLLEELRVEGRDGASGEASSPKFFQLFEDGTPYGLGGMERELGRLAMTREGGRNNALNAAAFSLGQLAAGGELAEDTARDALLEVALQIGLDADEARKTIESGWLAGEAEPRQAPVESKVEVEAETLPVPVVDEEARFWVDWEAEEEALPFYAWPILPKNAYVTVYGATEASKSMAWLGLLCEGSHHGMRSSVYSLENPPATDRDRLRRWAPDPERLRLTNNPIDFNDPRQVEALIRRERDWGTDVVMIDTYSHAFNSRSEDGNAKAIDFARRVRYVMAQVGCSVVVIDHTGYAQEDEPRDASAKRQQVDVAILMKKAGEWRPGQASRFTMTNKKAARFANPFFLNGEIRDAKGEGRGLELGWMGEHPRWEP